MNEACSLKDYKLAACANQGVMSGKKLRKVDRDVDFPRDEIFNEVQEVIDREKHKCSIILEGFEYIV